MSVEIVESTMTGMKGAGTLTVQPRQAEPPPAASPVSELKPGWSPICDPKVEYPSRRFGLRSCLYFGGIAPVVLALLIPLTWYSAQLLDDGLFALLAVAGAWSAVFWRAVKDGPDLLNNGLSAHHVRPIDWVGLPIVLCFLSLPLVPIGYIFNCVSDTSSGVAAFVGLILHTPIALGACRVVTMATSALVGSGVDGHERQLRELRPLPVDLFPRGPMKNGGATAGCRYFMALPIVRAIPEPEIQVITRAIALEHFLYFHEHPLDTPPDTTFDIRPAIDRWARKLGFEDGQRLHEAWDIRNSLLHSQGNRPRPGRRRVQAAAVVLLRGVERAIDLLPASEQFMFRDERSLHAWCQRTREPELTPFQRLIDLVNEVEGAGEGRARAACALRRSAAWWHRRTKLLPEVRQLMRLITWGWHLPTEGAICARDCARCAQLPPGKLPLPVIRRVQEAELRLVLLGSLVEFLVSVVRPGSEDTKFGDRLVEALGARRSVGIRNLMFALGARNDVVHPNTSRELGLDEVERAVHYLYDTVLDLLPLVPPGLQHAVTAQRPEAWPVLPQDIGTTLDSLHAVAQGVQQRRLQLRAMETRRRWVYERLDRLCGLDEIGLHLASWFAVSPTLLHGVQEGDKPSEEDTDFEPAVAEPSHPAFARDLTFAAEQ